MNATLLRTVHGLVAAILLAALIGLSAWTVTYGRPAMVGEGSRTVLLATGWVTLAFFLAAYAYVLRKYSHKIGYSPEFAMRMPRVNLERAHNKLDQIRYAIALGTLKGKEEILEKARRILVEEKVTQILRVSVETKSGQLELVIARTEPLVRVARWMHAHVYYGFAAGVLTLVHGGARFSSPMGIALNGLTILVVGTGLVGLVFWLYGPSWLTRLERDLTSEEAFVLARHYERRVAETLKPISEKDAALAARLREVAPGAERELATALAGVLGGADAEARARDVLALCGQRRRVRAEHARLARARFAMNAWRLVHIPASIVLLAVIVVHVVSVWLY